MKAEDIAKYFLTFTKEEEGDTISNLKLQKLLYYAQGFYLTLYDKPLFEEDIFAWDHGPVVKEVYHMYKEHGSNGIPVEYIELSEYDNVKDFLNTIYKTYGQFSAWKLREMTHEESPWQETKRNEIITHEVMKHFFSTRVEDE